MVLVVVLMILVLGLSGYIIYDKVIDVDNNDIVDNDLDKVDMDTDNSNNDVNLDDKDEDNDRDYVSGYLLDLMSDSDKNKLDDRTNYKDVDVVIGDVSLVFNCTGFGGAPGDYCYHTELLYNGSLFHEYDTVVGVINTNPYIIITNDY